jgi:hypothetical protein
MYVILAWFECVCRVQHIFLEVAGIDGPCLGGLPNPNHKGWFEMTLVSNLSIFFGSLPYKFKIKQC